MIGVEVEIDANEGERLEVSELVLERVEVLLFEFIMRIVWVLCVFELC